MAKSFSSPAYKYLCTLLYQERQKQGLSQRQLAAKLAPKIRNKKVETTQSYICRVEARSRRIDPSEFILYCRALGVDPCQLMKELEKFIDDQAKE